MNSPLKVLFITHFFYPHVGGVEKHVAEVSKSLKRKGCEATVLTEKYDNRLKDNETVNGIKVVRFSYIHKKILGLFLIWFWIFQNRKLIEESDIIHCHDVFIWYFPFLFLYPNKPVYTTFHGWEGIYPIPFKNILLKKLAWKLSWGTIAVGKYVEKYYSIKTNKIIYGGQN